MDQQAVDQHQIAERELLTHHALRRQNHQCRHCNGNDQTLADVQRAERSLVLYVGRFVFLQAFVVAARLELLVIEVFHRLVVQQAVYGTAVGLGIEFVRAPADIHAPLGYRDGEAQVNHHRGHGDRHEAPVEFGKQNERDQTEFDDYRNDRKQHVAQQRRDPARAAFNVARHAAGLSFEMESQTQAVQMPEHLQCDAADGALGHAHEYDVAQFGKQRRGQPQQAVDRQQREGQRQDSLLGIQRVDDFLHDQRDTHISQLGGREANQCGCHPPLELQEVGQQSAYGLPVVTAPDDSFGRSQGGSWIVQGRLREMSKP